MFLQSTTNFPTPLLQYTLLLHPIEKFANETQSLGGKGGGGVKKGKTGEKEEEGRERMREMRGEKRGEEEKKDKSD